MKCEKCNKKLSPTTKFCPHCGTPVSRSLNVKVYQKLGAVKGSVIGVVRQNESLDGETNIHTQQEIENVEEGGAIVGVAIDKKGRLNIGGKTIHGNQIVDNREQVIHTEGGQFIDGCVENNTVGNQGSTTKEIAELFSEIYKVIETRRDDSKIDKTELNQLAKEVENEAIKGTKASPKKVERLQMQLIRMAPDIGDVIIATLANPASGIAMVIKKIAEKVKAEAGTSVEKQ